MLIKLDYLVEKYNITIKGILHVGAHECEEIEIYDKYVSREKVLWVEAIEEKVQISKNKHPNILIENAVVSDKIEEVKFNISNNGQSSSMFELGLHKVFHPEIYYTNSIIVTTKLLGDIIRKYDDMIEFNFLNLDIQGGELKSLKGMEEYLIHVDYIYTEVNEDYVYEGCAIVTELDEFLKEWGFERVETSWYQNCKWGDAFYVKKNKKISI